MARDQEDYDSMLAEVANFNCGIEQGIDHAVLVLRAALEGKHDAQPGEHFANAGLEALRRDIATIRDMVPWRARREALHACRGGLARPQGLQDDLWRGNAWLT